MSNITGTRYSGVIKNSKDVKLWSSDKYLGYWSVELGFAIYCAYVLRCFEQKGSVMLKAAYKFHIFYHVKTIYTLFR